MIPREAQRTRHFSHLRKPQSVPDNREKEPDKSRDETLHRSESILARRGRVHGKCVFW